MDIPSNRQCCSTAIHSAYVSQTKFFFISASAASHSEKSDPFPTHQKCDVHIHSREAFISLRNALINIPTECPITKTKQLYVYKSEDLAILSLFLFAEMFPLSKNGFSTSVDHSRYEISQAGSFLWVWDKVFCISKSQLIHYREEVWKKKLK